MGYGAGGIFPTQPGSLRSGGGDRPGATLDQLMAQVSRLVESFEAERRRKLQQLAWMVEESDSTASGTQLVLIPRCQGLFRVLYIVAWSDSAATLQLKGDSSQSRLQLQIPAKVNINFPVGEAEAGGIFLTATDQRKLTMNGGNPTAGNMTLILTGVEVPDQQRW